ncbi:MAG: DUF4097 family beta strand repeat-containing protein [Bacillota bacterium]
MSAVKDERMLILQMLQEGKITAQEAYDLLEALALSEQASRDGVSEVWDEVKNRVERASKLVEEQAEKLREKITESYEQARERLQAAREKAAAGSAAVEGIEDVVISVERGLAQFAKELPQALERLLSLGLSIGPGHTVENVYEGSFGEGVQEARVAVQTHNGSVRWEAWDQPGYKVVVTSRVRAESEEAARERAARFVHWQAGDDGFRLSTEDRSDLSSSVTVWLPKSVRFRLETETRNGSVRAAGLSLTSAELRTLNGGIRLEDVEADELQAFTVNGGMRIEGAIGKLEGETTNGSIDARLSGKRRDGSVLPRAEWELETTNGSVRVRLPEGADIGYAVDLKTVNGRIRTALPGFETMSVRGAGRKVVWRSEGAESKPRRIELTAETVHGSIVVEVDDVVDQARPGADA